jgi:hypothetical protein
MTLIIDQNKQLLNIIAEENDLPIMELMSMIPSKQEIVQFITPRRREITTSSSESSSSVSSSSLVE